MVNVRHQIIAHVMQAGQAVYVKWVSIIIVLIYYLTLLMLVLRETYNILAIKPEVKVKSNSVYLPIFS